MKLASFDALVCALQQAGVRYLIAGGLAVNAHGYLRFTKDVDVVVRLVPGNIERAFAVLADLPLENIIRALEEMEQLAERLSSPADAPEFRIHPR